MAKITYATKSEAVDKLNPELYEKFSAANANEIKNKHNLLDDMVSAINSGYIPTSGSILPDPDAGSQYVTYVGQGIFTQTNGADVITTELLNLLTRSSEGVWSISVPIPIDSNLNIEVLSNGNFEIADESGFIAFKIDSQGAVDFYKLGESSMKAIAESTGLSSVQEGEFSVEDVEGNVAFKIDSQGAVDFYKLGSVLKKIISSSKREILPLSRYTDVNHVITYGQSLSVGQTEKVISSSSIYPQNLICFDGVVRTSPYDKSQSGDIYPTNRRLSFSPLKERVNDGVLAGLLAETPATGTAESLALEINKTAFKSFPALDMKILVSVPSEGASTIEQLSKGSDYYNRIILDVQAGLNISSALGKQYKVIAVTWTQGETDYIDSTSEDSYKASLIALKNDINTDIKAMTNQKEDVAFVMYQTATSQGGGKSFPNIALAQLYCALNETGIYMATPMYQMDYNDPFHLKSASSKLLGNYYGRTINEVVTLSEDVKPMHVISAVVQGSIIKLKMKVNSLPLVFDAANGVTLLNKGFSVIKSGSDILNSTSIGDDGDSVLLYCSSDPSGATVQYGVNVTSVPNSNVNLGNLRDSNGDNDQVVIDGNTYFMHNWCPIFTYLI